MNSGEKPKRMMIDSAPLLGDPEALWICGDEDGYLFFKQLLPKEDVRAVRRDFLAVVEGYGWRKSGQDEEGGVIDQEALKYCWKKHELELIPRQEKYLQPSRTIY